MKNISCRAAAFIIKENKLLFAKNVNSPCYYLVGGKIEENESSEAAVIREIFEKYPSHRTQKPHFQNPHKRLCCKTICFFMLTTLLSL